MPSDPQPPLFLQKIVSREEAPQRLAALPRPVVFTNGVFDVLHRGHATYLAHARALGGSLVVALNTDASARRLGKGADRPLNNEQDRAIMMAALESVSLVTWFGEDTPLELITELRPDLLVKGGDYDMDKLAETAVVRSYGGDARAIPFVDGYSTTALVKKIRAAPSGP
jgi:rfaE bifunctional protein nucleotidyltransferase chain/domain